MIKVNETISIREDEIQLDFIQASGPGGQNVNKTASQVQLRFDTNSENLPEAVRQRLKKIAANRINVEGILLISARRYRSQERNRVDALDRLVELIRRAAEKPKTRHPMQPTETSRRKRLEVKRQRGKIKQLRRRVEDE